MAPRATCAWSESSLRAKLMTIPVPFSGSSRDSTARAAGRGGAGDNGLTAAKRAGVMRDEARQAGAACDKEIVMQARDIMSSNIRIIPTGTSLRAAAELMRQMDVGILPVSDKGRIVGMLSDRDIAVRAVAEGADPSATSAGEVMTGNVISCYEDEDARGVAQLMSERGVRRVVVVNRKDEAVGIVSVDDLAMHPETRALADEVIKRFATH
ncbi:MAG TPA: CBS domain-containing protein [Burkholderiales bacterium]